MYEPLEQTLLDLHHLLLQLGHASC
eukprot:COSAG01_NODE_56277_length_319_cov_1.177273_1_plen_24_part_01